MCESQKRTLLVVDDSEILRGALVMYFSSPKFKNYKIESAKNGTEALRYLKNDNNNPDLVLTDIDMEPELSGIELARIIQKEYPTIAVILMSGRRHDNLNPGMKFVNKLEIECLEATDIEKEISRVNTN